MKIKLLIAASFLSAAGIFNGLSAQNYAPIAVTGFNKDVIANGIGSASSSTNSDVDGVSYAFVSRDFKAIASSTAINYGLPINGMINSAVSSTSGLTYQLTDYSSNNSLQLTASAPSGTLSFTAPASAKTLYLLATGGSGACTISATVNFGDGTSQTFSSLSIADWYGGTNYAIWGIGRVNRTNNNLEDGGGTNPRLYQIPMALSTANQSKNIVNVSITRATSSAGIPNIFGISMDSNNSCFPPSSIVSTAGMTDANITWTAPITSPSSYDYYMNTTGTAPTNATPPTGNTATNSLLINNLSSGTTYYLWIRSNCGGSLGFWTATQFTPGQVTATYSSGDISTLYSSSPTINTTTTCPGVLSVIVPAGYKVGSTAVSYNMTTGSNGYGDEQKSYLICTSNGNKESALSSGTGSSSVTVPYNRSGLSIANNLTGTVNFELRAFRTYGGSGCNVTYNKVDNNSFKITLTLVPDVNLATTEVSTKSVTKVHPNPFTDVININDVENVKDVTVLDFSGKVIKTIDKPAKEMHLGDIHSGMYLLQLNKKNGTTETIKVIKK